MSQVASSTVSPLVTYNQRSIKSEAPFGSMESKLYTLIENDRSVTFVYDRDAATA